MPENLSSHKTHRAKTEFSKRELIIFFYSKGKSKEFILISHLRGAFIFISKSNSCLNRGKQREMVAKQSYIVQLISVKLWYN